MQKPTKTGILLVLVFSALAAPQNKEQTSKPRPAAEMQKLAKMLVGTWKVDEDFAPFRLLLFHEAHPLIDDRRIVILATKP